MAHRRKNSNPVCKQKRISSVVDRVLAAKLQEKEQKKIIFGEHGESQTTDTDRNSSSGTESVGPVKHVLSEKSTGSNIPTETSSKERNQNLAIPDDLVGEFQALKKATNLDTASLMRRLIHDYSCTPPPEKNMGSSRLSSQLFDVSIQSSDKDRSGLIDYYETDRSISPGDVTQKGMDSCRRSTANMVNNDTHHTHKPVEVQRNPSPARMFQAEPYYWSDENYQSRDAEDTYSTGYRNSMKVPTVVREQHSDSSSEGQGFLGNIPSNSRQRMFAPSDGSEHSARNSTHDQNVEYMYSNESPEQTRQEGYMPSTPAIDNGSVSSAFPLVASLCDENGIILSPKQNEDLESEQKTEENIKFSDDIISQTDAHMAMQALNPHGVTAKLHKASGKSKAKKGQMKLIAENTSNHGVYTSVLKLPWSRRTRTPKNDPAQTTKNTVKAQRQPDDSTLYEDNEGQIPGVKTEPIEESADEPQHGHAVAPQLQQPYMLVPVTGIPSSQNGIFVPTNSTVPLPHDPNVNAPMMMVYPNSSFASVGRPVRKRGRPPKVPVLTRMLSDTSKIPRFDFPVTNFFPQFPPCPQPAIVLNVNNMMNTGDVGNATNNTNANVNTTTATNVVESKVQQTPQNDNQQQVNQQQFSKEVNKNVPPVVSESIRVNVPIETQIYNMAEQKINELQPTILSQQNMTTTASIANAQSGAIYQEMILSSKSLVNVRPRKRQSTTELLKSKSTSSNEFICTSFKLRNMNKPEKEKKKSPWMPGMKRRGRPPKKKMFTMMQSHMENTIQNPAQFLPATIHHFPQGVVPSTVQPPEIYTPIIQDGHHAITPQISPNGVPLIHQTGEESDSNASSSASVNTSSNEENKVTDDNKDECGKDMFQQLFHCKICNEIVPVEKRNEHREKHVQIKYCCNKCESVKISYVKKNDLTKDENIDKLLKCHECKAADNKVNESSVSLMCTQCNERFLQFSSLANHKQNAHQNTTVKEFNCSECDKSFLNYQKYKLHQQLCHEIRYHACPYQNCQKVYPAQSKLQAHIRKRHEKIASFRCIFEGCKEKFSNHGSLEEHIKSKHYSVKGYTCSKPGCDEEFTSERDLKFHLLLHNDSDMCTYECEICDYRCHQQHVLDWHMTNLHPETRNESTESAEINQ